MKRLLALLLLLLLGVAAAARAQSPCSGMPGGIGGTGITADGGIGGTGITPNGGIGGTGTRADAELSLIGVVTGFGSICVNGVEVHYDASTPVTLDGEPSSASALAVGHVVAVRAFGNSAEARARAVDISSAAVGRVTAIERPGDSLHVFGQPVRIEPWTAFGPGLARPALAQVGVGEPLRVSGLRRADGTIVATRIERAPSAGESIGAPPDATTLEHGAFIVQGYVADTSAAGEVRVSGMPFRVPARIAEQLARDRLVRLSGHTQADGARIVERADVLAAPLDPRPERTLVREGDNRRGRDSGSGDSGRGGDSGSSDTGRGDNSGSGSDRSDRSGPDRGGRSGQSGPDRPERPERGGSGRVERPERPERPERGGSDRVDRPERVERSGRH
jgi:hypothetical protein